MPSNVCSTTSAGFIQAMGGLPAILLFVLALAAFVIQSSLTQYVQSDLQFRQPYFLLYISHSSFTIIFPLHVLYLSWTTRKPLTAYFSTLRKALASRLLPSASDIEPFPIHRLWVLILSLTAGINIPALLWYAAVSLTSISDVTALWNTNSFWVYVLSSWLYGSEWEFRKLGAVLLATIGVIVDIYGGSTSGRSTDITGTSPSNTFSRDSITDREGLPSTAPFAGDLLTLIASIAYALYQVLYKHYVALPSDDVTGVYILQSPTSSPSTNSNGNSHSHSPATTLLTTRSHYQALSDHDPGFYRGDLNRNTSLLSPPNRTKTDANGDGSVKEVLDLPFGLYANLITSSVGLSTVVFLSFGFPFLHWASLEQFRLPPDTHTTLCIAGIALSGLTFNASFMILLGLWGPILTSVGNLLTIVLVIIADFFFNHGAITIWGLAGAVMIASAFAILALDIIQVHGHGYGYGHTPIVIAQSVDNVL